MGAAVLGLICPRDCCTARLHALGERPAGTVRLVYVLPQAAGGIEGGPSWPFANATALQQLAWVGERGGRGATGKLRLALARRANVCDCSVVFQWNFLRAKVSGSGKGDRNPSAVHR
jgi:hypothetical protein